MLSFNSKRTLNDNAGKRFEEKNAAGFEYGFTSCFDKNIFLDNPWIAGWLKGHSADVAGNSSLGEVRNAKQNDYYLNKFTHNVFRTSCSN